MAAKPQFSLRLLFIVVAAVALVTGEAVAFPAWLTRIVGFAATSLFLVALFVGLAYAKGYRKAFCVGAIMVGLATRLIVRVLPLESVVTAAEDFDPIAFHWRILFCLLWVEMLVGGSMGLAVRWFLDREASNQPPRSGDGI
jgi:hypothetical protein